MYLEILTAVLFVECILVLYVYFHLDFDRYLDLDHFFNHDPAFESRWCGVDTSSIKARLARLIDRERTRWKPIKPFPLFRLPREIRERIYSFMVPASDSCIYISPITGEFWRWRHFRAQRRISLLSIWSCDIELFKEIDDRVAYGPYPWHFGTRFNDQVLGASSALRFDILSYMLRTKSFRWNFEAQDTQAYRFFLGSMLLQIPNVTLWLFMENCQWQEDPFFEPGEVSALVETFRNAHTLSLIIRIDNHDGRPLQDSEPDLRGLFAPLAQGSFSRLEICLSPYGMDEPPLTPAETEYLKDLEKKCVEEFDRARQLRLANLSTTVASI